MTNLTPGAAQDRERLLADALSYLVRVYAHIDDDEMSLGQRQAWDRARAALAGPQAAAGEDYPGDHIEERRDRDVMNEAIAAAATQVEEALRLRWERYSDDEIEEIGDGDYLRGLARITTRKESAMRESYDSDIKRS